MKDPSLLKSFVAWGHSCQYLRGRCCRSCLFGVGALDHGNPHKTVHHQKVDARLQAGFAKGMRVLLAQEEKSSR